METFEGLVYVKHGRIGTKSEGPDYYLQTWENEYLLKYGDRGPWELDESSFKSQTFLNSHILFYAIFHC